MSRGPWKNRGPDESRRRLSDQYPWHLTPTEWKLLEIAAKGYSDRHIETLEAYTHGVAGVHMRHVYAKMGLTMQDIWDRRVKAVLMYQERMGTRADHQTNCQCQAGRPAQRLGGHVPRQDTDHHRYGKWAARD